MEAAVPLGNTADVMSAEGGTIYLRHQAFKADLTDAVPGKHLMATAGMLESQRNHREYKGTYAGRRGAILRAVSAADGATLAEYKLDKLPAWDGMAVAYGRLFIVNLDGSVECWGN